MVTPEAAGWFCMGFPFTEDPELCCPLCAEPLTVAEAAVESVADFLVAEAYEVVAWVGWEDAGWVEAGVAVLCPWLPD